MTQIPGWLRLAQDECTSQLAFVTTDDLNGPPGRALKPVQRARTAPRYAYVYPSAAMSRVSGSV